MSSARKHIMLGTAGHVDHGKTALVKLLTGCDLDTLAAEKDRGLTIELGFAPCRMRDERIVGIVDVPGHVDFIRNMVAGAHGVDVVIFVVAADDGVMPQTREHLDILTLMGARHGVVALTKIDLVDPELRELVAEDVQDLLKGTFLASAAVCPVSNVTGEGFDQFFEELDKAVAACREREAGGLFRMWIERAFTIRGFGTVASGIPSSGEVRVGDTLRLLPGRHGGRVRRMEVYGQEAPFGRAGECVALNLADIEHGDLARGQVLCEGDAFEAVGMAEAELRLLAGMPVTLKDYAEVHVHVGTADVMAHVALLDGGQLGAGQSGMVQLRLAQPLGIAAGDRFVIRTNVGGAAGGRVTTIGGGRVLGTGNVRLRRNRPWVLAALAARREAIDAPGDWCAVCLKEAKVALSPGELGRRAGMPTSQVESILPDLRAAGVVEETSGGTVVHRDVVDDVGRELLRQLDSFHDANPMRLGMEAEEAAAQLQADRAAFDLAALKLAREGLIERHGTLLASAARKVELAPDDAALCRRIEQTLRDAHLSTPLMEDLAAALGEGVDRVRAMVRLLADEGAVVSLDRKVVMHREAVDAAKRVALDLFARKGGFTTMEFRDALGVSRKYAVPLLDYFDTLRLTVRSGNRRTPGALAKEARRGNA